MTLLPPEGMRPVDPAYNLLFVYGTLRRGFSHHHILERLHARAAGRGSIRAELYDFGAFPGAKPAALDVDVSASGRVPAGESAQAPVVPHVNGELYQLQNLRRDLKVLDGYEGFRPSAPGWSIFRRELTEVWSRGRGATLAWVYWLNRTAGAARRIAEGDYALR